MPRRPHEDTSPAHPVRLYVRCTRRGRARPHRAPGSRPRADGCPIRAALFGLHPARQPALAARPRRHRACRVGRAPAPYQSVLMRYLLLAGLAMVPAGCERAAADAQLAAKVNGSEIALRQLRSASAANLQQALDKVIDRELLVQKALKAGLERD